MLGGEADGAAVEKLLSLGSISYQPLMIFYRGATKRLLSEFKGLRIDIGPDGSGSNSLAHALLAANGIKAGRRHELYRHAGRRHRARAQRRAASTRSSR